MKLWHKIICSVVMMLALTSCQQQVSTEQETKNMSTVQQMFKEVIEQKNLEKLNDYFATDFVMDSNGKQRNFSEFKKHLEETFTHVNSLQVSDMADRFTHDDKVVERYTLTITDKKGNKQHFTIISIYQLKDNKIVKWWDVAAMKEKK